MLLGEDFYVAVPEIPVFWGGVLGLVGKYFLVDGVKIEFLCRGLSNWGQYLFFFFWPLLALKIWTPPVAGIRNQKLAQITSGIF